MEAKLPEITLGETVCRKLKDIYFNDDLWIDSYRGVAIKLSELKRIAKDFYVDKNDVEALKELIKYSDTDIVEAFNNKDCYT